MPYNGSGTFTPYTPGNPVVTGTVISSTAFNATQQDLAAGLSNAVTRDGQSPLTANLPMAGRKLTGLGAGVVAGDSLRFEQLFSQGAEQDIASAATVDIGGLNTTIARITGTTTITSFGTNYNGPRFARFAGALTLTNSATLLLPGGANITTAAGDRAILTPIGNPATGWQVLAYQRADGTAVSGAAASTIALTNDATTNAAHYPTFADGTAGQENLKTDTAKLAYNPSTGALSATSFVGSGASLTGIGGRVAQVQRSFSGALATGTTATAWDDTIPQITEGDQYYTVTITPQNAASLLEIDVVMNVSCSSIAQSTVALHQDSIADALAATPAYSPAAGQPAIGVIKYFVTAGSTTARTYRVRVGNNGAGTVTINGSNGTRRYGGVMQSGISVREILP